MGLAGAAAPPAPWLVRLWILCCCRCWVGIGVVGDDDDKKLSCCCLLW